MTTKDTLRTIFAEMLKIEPATITDDASLDAMGGDSLDSVEILLEVESQMNLVIDDEPWEACRTFADYVTLVEGLVPCSP